MAEDLRWWANTLGPLPGPDNPDWVRRMEEQMPPRWGDWKPASQRIHWMGADWMAHLWDNVAVWVALDEIAHQRSVNRPLWFDELPED